MTAATAAWAVLMIVPIILVAYVLPKFDAWLDRRRAERRQEWEVEQKQFDDVFLDIVTTQLADLEVRRLRDE